MPLSGANAHLLFDLLPRALDVDAVLRLIETVRLDVLGPGLLTVNRVLWPQEPTTEGKTPDAIELQRLWTSLPQAYPVGGRKHKRLTPWSETLLLRAEVFVGEGVDALRQVFDDARLIEFLGLQSVMNVPVPDEQGRCVATFNVLTTSDRWTAEQCRFVQWLAALAAPVILRAQA